VSHSSPPPSEDDHQPPASSGDYRPDSRTQPQPQLNHPTSPQASTSPHPSRSHTPPQPRLSQLIRPSLPNPLAALFFSRLRLRRQHLSNPTAQTHPRRPAAAQTRPTQSHPHALADANLTPAVCPRKASPCTVFQTNGRDRFSVVSQVSRHTLFYDVAESEQEQCQVAGRNGMEMRMGLELVNVRPSYTPEVSRASPPRSPLKYFLFVCSWIAHA
jgi:hypothetical protein